MRNVNKLNLRVLFAVWAVMMALGAFCGCQRGSGRYEPQFENLDPLVVTEGADLQRNKEVQLVEQMARYRTSYREHLMLLRQFYDRQGNHLKADWARQEIENLDLGPKRPYLVLAEVAGPDLRAERVEVEADLLYQEGLESMKQGRGGLGKLFMDKKKLYLAIEKFDELIRNYPDSDKIDDAAFQIGEINRHYLEDYRTALLYYQRVWQWDPQTILPARYAVARIYDDALHDRIKALEYYNQVIRLEADYPSNVEYARGRIDEINREQTND